MAGDQGRDAMGADRGGQDHVFGTAAPQFRLAVRILGPGDDDQMAVDARGGERHEDVGGIAGQHRRELSGVFDAGLPQDRLVGGVAEHDEVTVGLGGVDLRPIAVHHDHFDLALGQALGEACAPRDRSHTRWCDREAVECPGSSAAPPSPD